MPSIPSVGVFAPAKGNCDFFSYVANLAELDAGDSNVDQIQISADSDFYWNATTYQVDIAGAAFTDSTRPIPNITMQITDNGSNRNLFDEPVPIPTIAGTGELPYRLIHPRLFTRSTSFTVSFANYDAAADYDNLYVVFHGFKVYTLG